MRYQNGWGRPIVDRETVAVVVLVSSRRRRSNSSSTSTISDTFATATYQVDALSATLGAQSLPPRPPTLPSLPPPPPLPLAALRCYAARYQDLLGGFCFGAIERCSWNLLMNHWVQAGRDEERVFGCASPPQQPPHPTPTPPPPPPLLLPPPPAHLPPLTHPTPRDVSSCTTPLATSPSSPQSGPVSPPQLQSAELPRAAPPVPPRVPIAQVRLGSMGRASRSASHSALLAQCIPQLSYSVLNTLPGASHAVADPTFFESALTRLSRAEVIMWLQPLTLHMVAGVLRKRASRPSRQIAALGGGGGDGCGNGGSGAGGDGSEGDGGGHGGGNGGGHGRDGDRDGGGGNGGNDDDWGIRLAIGARGRRRYVGRGSPLLRCSCILQAAGARLAPPSRGDALTATIATPHGQAVTQAAAHATECGGWRWGRGVQYMKPKYGLRKVPTRGPFRTCYIPSAFAQVEQN